MGNIDSEIQNAVEFAFDYRGDVTITDHHGNTIVCYLFNRDFDTDPPTIEFFTKDSLHPVSLELSEIRSIELTGKDTAAGRSWENWLVKRAEAEKMGKIAELYPDDLDEETNLAA